IKIRSAATGDASELTIIAFAAKWYWGYPEEWIALWADQLTVDGTYIEANRVFLADDGACILGWCAVAERREEYWIDYCWVLPEATRSGIGRALVQHAFRLVAELRASTVKVVADPNAEGFYCKLGFRLIGNHPSVPSGRSLPVLEAEVAIADDKRAELPVQHAC